LCTGSKKKDQNVNKEGAKDKTVKNIAILEAQIKEEEELDMNFAISTMFLMLKKCIDNQDSIREKVDKFEVQLQNLKKQ
jgi:hypothetical protein